MPQRKLSKVCFLLTLIASRPSRPRGCKRILQWGTRRGRRDGGQAYKSQGERPLVDFVCQLLMSCGMSCMLQKVTAPATKGGGETSKLWEWDVGEQKNPADTWFQDVLGSYVYEHYRS